MMNITAKAMHCMDWAIKEAATKLNTLELDSNERKEFASRLRGAREAYAELKLLRKNIAQGATK